MTFDPDNFNPDDYEQDDPEELLAKLSPKDAMGIGVATMSFLSSPLGHFSYPEWSKDFVKMAVKAMQLEGDLNLGSKLIQMGIISSVVMARMNIYMSEQTGIPLDEADESHLIADPAQLIEAVVSNLPDDDYFEAFFEDVKAVYEKQGPGKELDDAAIQQLEEWFNGEDAEEPNA